MEIIFIPSIIFMAVVAPIWLILHYRHKTKMAKGISQEEVHDVEELLETLDRLIDRVETLEDILDSEHSDWRKSRRRNK